MPIRPCPECDKLTIRWLEASSRDAHVNYYRCDGCGHVWTLPKSQPDAAPTAVTRTDNPQTKKFA